MEAAALDRFIVAALARAHSEPADRIAAIAPLMHGLLALADGHMDNFHLCDVAAGTRRKVNLAHNES